MEVTVLGFGFFEERLELPVIEGVRKDLVDGLNDDGHGAGKCGRLGAEGLLVDDAVKGVDLLSISKVTAVFYKQGGKPFRQPIMTGAPSVVTPQSHAKSVNGSDVTCLKFLSDKNTKWWIIAKLYQSSLLLPN